MGWQRACEGEGAPVLVQQRADSALGQLEVAGEGRVAGAGLEPGDERAARRVEHGLVGEGGGQRGQRGQVARLQPQAAVQRRDRLSVVFVLGLCLACERPPTYSARSNQCINPPT